MNKRLSGILPFLCMFLLATGSVAVSCATAPARDGKTGRSPISVNTGPSPDGKVYTSWVFDRVLSVLVIDGRDRSRKIEIPPRGWTYDPRTTELTFREEIPFPDYIARVEGVPAHPHSFALGGITDENDLLVVIGDRLAIGGYDYGFDPKGRILTFRDDVNLRQSDWRIQYATAHGMTTLGEWKPENEDRMSYLEAESRKRRLDSWYDSQTDFWFFDDTRTQEWMANPERPPALIRRPATMAERADMKSAPLPVIKFRTGAKARDLSRETGLDARIPALLRTGSPRGEYPLAWITIDEYSRNGKLSRELDIAYEASRGSEAEGYLLQISMEKSGEAPAGDETGQWRLDETTLDLGRPVLRVRQWGLMTIGLDDKPDVALLSTWSWTEGPALFRVTAPSDTDGRTAALLTSFIAARKETARR